MNEYAFLKATKPSVSKGISRSAKVQWHGLNMNAHADTGYIVDGRNFYVTADGTLRAIDKPVLFDNGHKGKPLAFCGIDGKLFYVYKKTGSDNNVDIVRYEDLSVAGNGDSVVNLSNKNELSTKERSLARYNVWNGGSDIVTGKYAPRLLIYPDAEWLDFDGDWKTTKSIQCFEIVENVTKQDTIVEETYNNEVSTVDQVGPIGTWFFDKETGDYFVSQRAHGKTTKYEKTETKSVYGYSDDDDEDALPSEKRTIGKSTVTFTIQEGTSTDGSKFKYLTRKTVRPETVTAYSYAGSRYRIVKVTKTSQVIRQETYTDKATSAAGVDGYDKWYYDASNKKYTVSSKPSGSSTSKETTTKEEVYKEASSETEDLPDNPADKAKEEVFYEVEDFPSSDGSIKEMLVVSYVNTTIKATYKMSDLGSPVPGADFITPWNNRIFGVDGTKIFASAAGSYVDYDLDTADDFDGNNAWYSATQSGGDFTHICTYGGRPVAFKADMLYELYNDKNPFRIKEISRIGTFNGASVCEVNSTLFYANKDGIYAYGGSYPRSVSEGFIDKAKLEDGKFTRCVAGSYDGKYFVRAPFKSETDEGFNPILIFDTVTSSWSIMDAFDEDIAYFAECDGKFFAVQNDGKIYIINSGDKGGVAWSFETPVITDGTADRTVLEKVQMLVKFHGSGSVRVSVKYDNGTYESIGNIVKGSGVHPFYCKVRRSDHAVRYIKFDCVGDVEILTFEQFLSQGGDR